MSAPMTYVLDGVQYVAVTAGAGGPQGAKFVPGHVGQQYQNYERLLVFKLDGQPVNLPAKQVPVVGEALTTIAATPETMARGRELYTEQCQRCHAMGGGVGITPDLWQMSQATVDAFDMIVGEGALRYAGMGSFDDLLSREEIAALKAFIVNDSILKKAKGQAAGAHSNLADH